MEIMIPWCLEMLFHLNLALWSNELLLFHIRNLIYLLVVFFQNFVHSLSVKSFVLKQDLFNLWFRLLPQKSKVCGPWRLYNGFELVLMIDIVRRIIIHLVMILIDTWEHVTFIPWWLRVILIVNLLRAKCLNGPILWWVHLFRYKI